MKFIKHMSGKADKNLFACIVSGDGLFTPLSRFLADRLSRNGVPTVRVKAIRYFWFKRSPKTMSDDLSDYIAQIVNRNADSKILFVGYSFGAGTLPFALNRLPNNYKSKIQGVVLIAPPSRADFQFFFRSWFHRASHAAVDVAPEIDALSKSIPIWCLFGEEDHSGPREEILRTTKVRVKTLKGGHAFNKEYEDIYKIIEAEVL